MWICTPIGFFSVVRKTGENHLTIRSRVAKDLEDLREKYLENLGPTMSGVGTDYAHRAQCSPEEWGVALSKMSLDIDYGNFKRQVKKIQGASRASIYTGVWNHLWKLNILDG